VTGTTYSSRPARRTLLLSVLIALTLVAGCVNAAPGAGPTDTGVQAFGDTERDTTPDGAPPVTTPAPVYDDPILDVTVEDAPEVDQGPEFTYEFAPELGDPVGRIRIPLANVDWPVLEGVERRHLDVSPGHMPRTPMPGQLGNAVIAGHRTTFGAPFYDLDLLNPGDPIYVDTGIGTHTYEVVSTEIVLPTAMWTVQHRPGGWLTLIACHPKGTNAQRIIVFARIVDGPNAAAIAETYSGPYDPPVDPGPDSPEAQDGAFADEAAFGLR